LPYPDLTPELTESVRNAYSIAVLTGAGISAESGIPTFRDARSGLWEKYRPEDLATPQAFRKNPFLVWEWYAWRLSLVGEAHPNPGHYAISAIEASVKDFTLITQNVDGLHQQAGSKNVIELHGSIRSARCCQENTSHPISLNGLKLPPHCPDCGGLLRPDVVWFGEPLPQKALADATAASEAADVFLSIGTSGIVEPAASLPYLALRRNAVVIEINPEPTPLTVYAHHYLPYPAGKILPALVKAAWPESFA
jgi:NAD-dependent deacetylase